MKRILPLMAGLALLSCSSDDPAPAPAGIAPKGPASVAAPAAPVNLAEPPAAAAPEEEAAAAPQLPAATITFEVEPLGRFEVLTWTEALRRGVTQIDELNVHAELFRVQQDVRSRQQPR